MYQKLNHQQRKCQPLIHHLIHRTPFMYQGMVIFLWAFIVFNYYRMFVDFYGLFGDSVWLSMVTYMIMMPFYFGIVIPAGIPFTVISPCCACTCCVCCPIKNISLYYRQHIASYCIGYGWDKHQIAERITAANYYLQCVFHDDPQYYEWKQKRNKQNVLKIYNLHQNAYQDDYEIPLDEIKDSVSARFQKWLHYISDIVWLAVAMLLIWIKSESVKTAVVWTSIYGLCWISFVNNIAKLARDVDFALKPTCLTAK